MKDRKGSNAANEADATATSPSKDQPIPGATSEVQGEGDYKAARRYNERTTEYAKRSDVEGAARKAAPDSTASAADMERAEREGRARAKEEDPLLDRPEDIEEDDSGTSESPPRGGGGRAEGTR